MAIEKTTCKIVGNDSDSESIVWGSLGVKINEKNMDFVGEILQTSAAVSRAKRDRWSTKDCRAVNADEYGDDVRTYIWRRRRWTGWQLTEAPVRPRPRSDKDVNHREGAQLVRTLPRHNTLRSSRFNVRRPRRRFVIMSNVRAFSCLAYCRSTRCVISLCVWPKTPSVRRRPHVLLHSKKRACNIHLLLPVCTRIRVCRHRLRSICVRDR
jgi:hypothetical protein